MILIHYIFLALSQAVQAIEDGEFSVASATADERVWVVTFSRDDGASSSYIYNR